MVHDFDSEFLNRYWGKIESFPVVEDLSREESLDLFVGALVNLNENWIDLLRNNIRASERRRDFLVWRIGQYFIRNGVFRARMLNDPPKEFYDNLLRVLVESEEIQPDWEPEEREIFRREFRMALGVDLAEEQIRSEDMKILLGAVNRLSGF